MLVSAGDQHHWHRVCNALGKPEWLEDPRFNTRHERLNNKDLVNEAINELLADKTMEQAIAHFTDHDVVAAPVNTIPMAAEDPHPWERRAMVEVPDFLAGEIAVSGDFWHFSRTPVNIGTTPQVGEHNEGRAVRHPGLQRRADRIVPRLPGHLGRALLRRHSGVGAKRRAGRRRRQKHQ